MEEAQPGHPYSPASAPLPHYVENELPLPVVVGSLAVMLAAVALGSAGLAARLNPRLGLAEKCTVAWFCICMGSRSRLDLEGSLCRGDGADLGRRVSSLLL